jgi:hypothetical protein
MSELPPLKVMVASTVYGFETELKQICSTLAAFGYHVLNSHIGTIRTDPRGSNLGDCLRSVEECDVFVGIINPHYGSGVIGELSITHSEMRHALDLNKPRWILVHERVEFLRQILKKNAFNQPFQKTSVLDNPAVVELYDEMLQSKIPVEDRTGYWVQPFSSLDDVLQYLDTNLKDVNIIREIIASLRNESKE